MVIESFLQAPTTLDLWLYILLSPVAEIFYFGVLSGVLFIYAWQNQPNRQDIYIGTRIGNILRLFKHMAPSDKKQDFTYNKGMYKLDKPALKLEMKHGIFSRPMWIFDEDNLTPIKTTQPNMKEADETKVITPEKTITKTTKDKDGNITTTTEVIPAKTTTVKKKSTNYPLDVNLDTQWNISAHKIYDWWKEKMMETTWAAVIGKALTQNIGQLILFLSMGWVIGMLTLYAIEPIHVVNTVVTTTNTIVNTSHAIINGTTH